MKATIYIHMEEPTAVISSEILGLEEHQYMTLNLDDQATIFLSPENAERLSAELTKLQEKQEAA